MKHKFEAQKSLDLDYCADPTKVSAYANNVRNTYVLNKSY